MASTQEPRSRSENDGEHGAVLSAGTPLILLNGSGNQN